MRVLTLAFAVLLGASLSGCDGEECWLCWGGQPNQGRLTLGLYAVQTDQINELQLSLSGVAFLNANNDWKRFDFNPPRQIILIQRPDQFPGQDPLQAQAVLLLDQEHLDGGRYQAIQLFVDDYPDSSESFVDVGGAIYRLDLPQPFIVPSSTFQMPRHGLLELVIDLDLHRGLARLDSFASPPEALELLPHMRLVDIADRGWVSGTVAANRMQHSFCLLGTTGSYSGFVYIFAGDTKPAEALASGIPPVTSIPIVNTIGSDSRFQANFLSEGDYTLALVCEGEGYRPYASTNIAILRTTSRPVQVRAGGTTGVPDFSQ